MHFDMHIRLFYTRLQMEFYPEFWRGEL